LAISLALIFNTAEASDPVVYFHLPRESVAPGSEFVLTVLIQSDLDLNAFEIAIEFTPERLEFLGYADAGSILDVWQTSPRLQDGNIIIFSGGATKPFRGEAGELVKLKFRTKSSGTAGFALRDSNLYVANGTGTQFTTSPFYLRLIVDDNAPKIYLENNSDRTPPRLEISKVENPVNRETLLVFEVKDAESGSGKVFQRTFEGWRFSEWKEIKSPIKFPETAWILQIRAQNGAGEKSDTFFWNENAKLLGALFALLFVLLAAYFCYNKYKSIKWA